MKTFHFATPEQRDMKLLCKSVPVGETCLVTYGCVPDKETYVRKSDKDFGLTLDTLPGEEFFVMLDNNYNHFCTTN